MTFRAQEVLRLEVEADPAPGQLVNLVVNPNGEMGGYGWNSIQDGAYIAGIYDDVFSNPARWYLQYIGSTVVGASIFRTESMPMTAGQYVGGRWRYIESGGDAYRARFSFLNASGAVISSTAYFTYNSTTDDVDANTAVFQAPANTVAVYLAFEVGDPGGVYPIATRQASMRLTNVTVAVAATSAALKTTRKNLLTNPSFETNTTGWSGGSSDVTIARTTTQKVFGTYGLSVTRSTVTGNQGNQAEYVTNTTVTAGDQLTVSAYVYPTRSGSRRFYVRYVGGPADVQQSYTAPLNTWTRVSWTFTVPVGATAIDYLFVQLDNEQTTGLAGYVDGALLEKYQAGVPTTYFDGATAAAGGWTYAWDGTANASTSTASLSLLSYIQPVPYTDILGDLRELSTSREELNVGTLSAVVANPNLSPAVADTIRPGRRFRLVGKKVIGGEFIEQTIGGRLTNAKVDYFPQNTDPSRRALITLTGTDNVSLLANAKRSSSVAKISELPYVLEGAGVPWVTDGSSNQIASANVVVTNDNASALDQVALTRDTVGGYSWVDRFGVLRAVSAFPDPTADPINNGSFNSPVTFVSAATSNGWTIGTLATATSAVPPSPSPNGGNAARLVPTGSWQVLNLAAQSKTSLTTNASVTFWCYMPVNQGGTYRARAYLRSNVSRVAQMQVTGVAEDDVSTIAQWTVPYTATPTASWGTWEIEFTVPPGVAAVAVEFQWLYDLAASQNLPNTDIHWVDGVSLTAIQATPYVLDESVYNRNLVVDYDTDRCINSVAVHRQWNHTSEGPQETVYGPYTDAASISEWGTHHADVTVAGTAPASIPAFANAILAKNGTPAVGIQRLEIPINADTLEFAYIDLYDLVQVINANLGIDVLMRVTGVSHVVTADPDAHGDRWKMILDFAPQNSVATPTVQPALNGQPEYGRRRWAAYSTATTAHGSDNSWVTIAGFDTPFPGFSTTEVDQPAVSPFTYGSGVITALVSGWIQVHFSIEFANDTTPTGGRKGVRIRGSNHGGSNQPSASFQAQVVEASPQPLETSYSGPLAAGETLTVQAFQQSGGSLNITYRGLTVDFDPFS